MRAPFMPEDLRELRIVFIGTTMTTADAFMRTSVSPASAARRQDLGADVLEPLADVGVVDGVAHGRSTDVAPFSYPFGIGVWRLVR